MAFHTDDPFLRWRRREFLKHLIFEPISQVPSHQLVVPNHALPRRLWMSFGRRGLPVSKTITFVIWATGTFLVSKSFTMCSSSVVSFRFCVSCCHDASVSGCVCCKISGAMRTERVPVFLYPLTLNVTGQTVFFDVLKWSIACRLWSTIFSVNAIEGHRLVHDCIPFILSCPEFFGWRPLDEDLFRVSLILWSIDLKVVVGLKCPIHLHNQFGNILNLGIFWNETARLWLPWS